MKRGRASKADDTNKTATNSKKQKNGDTAKPEPLNTELPLNEIDYSCSKTNKLEENHNLKIVSWNVAGLRACVKKNGLKYLKAENADIICLQEVKCDDVKLPPEVKLSFPNHKSYWCAGSKPGYAGVGLLTREKPIEVKYGLGDPEYDIEGRLIVAEFQTFFVVTTYVPNSGQLLKTLPKRMKWDSLFFELLKNLDNKKPVILVGDLNVAHNEIDLANPKTNTRSAGFTIEERNSFSSLLEKGFIDSFRHMYPDKTGAYTYWTYMGNARSRNTGWRLDYFVVSERIMDKICDNVMRNRVMGSDHCPIVLYINI